jgi:uncharacterized cupin superfamily protein
MTRRHPNVVNVDELSPVQDPHGRFDPRTRFLAEAASGREIGCSHVELAPGKVAWPFHHHLANEEAIFVLEGTGTARIGDASIEIRAGDYIALPAGPSAAHQTINTGTGPLRYLCFSTMIPTDVVGYGDTGKVGVRQWERGPDGVRRRVLRDNYPTGTEVDYWSGEDLGD